MNTILIDIMTCGGAKFYGTLRYESNPLFRLDIGKLSAWVLSRRPLLKYEKGVVLFLDWKNEKGNTSTIKVELIKNKQK